MACPWRGKTQTGVAGRLRRPVQQAQVQEDGNRWVDCRHLPTRTHKASLKTKDVGSTELPGTLTEWLPGPGRREQTQLLVGRAYCKGWLGCRQWAAGAEGRGRRRRRRCHCGQPTSDPHERRKVEGGRARASASRTVGWGEGQWGPSATAALAAIWEGTAPGDSLVSGTGLSLGPAPRGDL